MLDFSRQLPQRKRVVNHTPRWLSVLLILMLIVAALYAAPNLFGDCPAVQLSSRTPGVSLATQDLKQVEQTLAPLTVPHSVDLEGKHVVVRFKTSDAQFAGKTALEKGFGDHLLIASFNAPATPVWLRAIGAKPMKLGLDLRGGMSLLLQVDVDTVVKRRMSSSVRNIGQTLRHTAIPYRAILPEKRGIVVHFRNTHDRRQALATLAEKIPQYRWTPVEPDLHDNYALFGVLSPAALTQLRRYTMEQTLDRLSRRVNELGISEAQVQQQGRDRVSIELPGVSDATEAQDILGKTATIDTYLVDTRHDLAETIRSGNIPSGDRLVKTADGQAVLLQNRVVLSGDQITRATAGFNQRTALPVVNISVAGGAQSQLYEITRTHIGKPMAVVYTQTRSTREKVNGRPVIRYHTRSHVINVANIQSAFGASFSITGLAPAESRQLALLLRAGALPAPITVLSERQVGPSMGKTNVARGRLSVIIGLVLVIVFMAVYYRALGIIADLALVVNLIFIVAIMSLLGGVMTFPGIASLVLTIGMAVDGNVLIFERIREELRRGSSIQAAIHAGYDRAVVTIVDAQLTTLIAAIVLLTIGAGSIKGFAVVLTIGLFTSMLTAITYTRAMVNRRYGGKKLTQLSIGIKIDRGVK